MNSKTLAGLTVLITRPSNQQQPLQQAIENNGGVVLSLPLIEIAPLAEVSAQQELKDKVMQLDNYQVLIFVSNNAVSYGAELINNYWPQFPQGIEVIAVGPTTAAAAREMLGCEVIQASSGMTSEDILDLQQLQPVQDKKIAIVRGQGGRELMALSLRQRGAKVDYLEAYSRKTIDYENSDFQQKLKTAGVNVLTVSSGESLHRLTALLQATGRPSEVGHSNSAAAMQRLSLLAPSERVAEQARQAGYKYVYNAKGADPASFVAALGELSVNQE